MLKAHTAPKSLLRPRRRTLGAPPLRRPSDVPGTDPTLRSLRPRGGTLVRSVPPMSIRAIPEGLGALLATVVAAALVTAAVVFVVWLKMVQVQAGYAIHELQRDVVELRQERSALEVEVSSLRRPDRLAQIGRERFHLAPPTPEQILRVDNLPSRGSRP